MGYAKDGREEIYETATNWQQGKTRFSINFVREAQEKILRTTNDREKELLENAIELVKQGRYILTEPETPEEILEMFGYSSHSAHG